MKKLFITLFFVLFFAAIPKVYAHTLDCESFPCIDPNTGATTQTGVMRCIGAPSDRDDINHCDHADDYLEVCEPSVSCEWPPNCNDVGGTDYCKTSGGVSGGCAGIKAECQYPYCAADGTCKVACDFSVNCLINPPPTVPPPSPPPPSAAPTPDTSYVCTNSGNPCSCSGPGCQDGGGTLDFRCCHREFQCQQTGTAVCITAFGGGGNACNNGDTQSCGAPQCVPGVSRCTKDSDCATGTCNTGAGVCDRCTPAPPPPTYTLDCSRFTATAKDPNGNTVTVGGTNEGAASVPVLTTLPGEVVKFQNFSIIDSGGVFFGSELWGQGKYCQETGTWMDPDTNDFNYCNNGNQEQAQGGEQRWDVNFRQSAKQHGIDRVYREIMMTNNSTTRFTSQAWHNGFNVGPYSNLKCVIDIKTVTPPPQFTCSPGNSLGGVLQGNPTGIVFNNKMYAFVQGRDQIYYKSATSSGGVANWDPFYTPIGGSNILSAPLPAVINGRLYLIAKGQDTSNPNATYIWVYFTYTDDGVNFSPWQPTWKTGLDPFDPWSPLIKVIGGTIQIVAHLTFDSDNWRYHETLSGGAGSSPSWNQWQIGDIAGALGENALNSVTFDGVNYSFARMNDKSLEVCGGAGPTPTPAPGTCFTDVTATDTTGNGVLDSTAVCCMKAPPDGKYDVVSGYNDVATCSSLGVGIPCLDKNSPLTRRQFASFLTRYHVNVLGDWVMQNPAVPSFTDVPTTDGGYRDIETAHYYNWLRGAGGAFNPDAAWQYGFHGVWRTGATNQAGVAQVDDCYAGCYDFTVLSPVITRLNFLKSLYDFGVVKAQLPLCTAPTPTPTPVIPPTFSITGRVFDDKDRNKVFNVGEEYAGAVGVSISPSPAGVAITYGANGTYTISGIPGGATMYTISYISALPAGYTMSWPFGTPPSFGAKVGVGTCFVVDDTTGGICDPVNPGSIKDLNFGITQSAPWFQGVGGSIRNDSGISNKVPATAICSNGYTLAPLNPAQANLTTGTIYAGLGAADFGSGISSAPQYVLSGAAGDVLFNVNFPPPLHSSYSYLSKKTLTPISLGAVCNLSDCILPAALPSGIYVVPGDLVLHASATPYTFPNGKFIFLVHHDLYINHDIHVNNGSYVGFSAGNNIIVNRNLGLPSPTCATANGNLEGVYSADKDVIFDHIPGACAAGSKDNQLQIHGTVISNASNKGGSILSQRDLCGQNLSYPAFVVTTRPDFILNAPEILKKNNYTFKEVAP